MVQTLYSGVLCAAGREQEAHGNILIVACTFERNALSA
jgi:hypothetical protein